MTLGQHPLVYAFYANAPSAVKAADRLVQSGFEIESLSAVGWDGEQLRPLPFGRTFRTGYAAAGFGGLGAVLGAAWGAEGGGAWLQRALDIELLGALPNFNGSIVLACVGATIGIAVGYAAATARLPTMPRARRGETALVFSTPPLGRVDDAANLLADRALKVVRREHSDEPVAEIRAALAAFQQEHPGGVVSVPA
jgi:hypothetical protein